MADLRKISTLFLPGLLVGAAAAADVHRFELRLTADHADHNLDDELGDAPTDFDAVGAAGTYYFKPVRTDGLPLSEAAFLNRSSFLSGAVVRSELGDEKIDLFGVSLGYYVPDTMLYGRLGFTYADDFSGDQTNFNGAIGLAPIAGLLVTTDFTEDGWDPNVTAKYVGKFDNGHYYAASIGLIDPDGDDLTGSLNLDYFFDTTFSLGAGIGEDSSTIRGEKFFKPNFSIGGRVTTADDGDGFGAFVKWRF